MATQIYASIRYLQALDMQDGERDPEATQPLPIMPDDLPDERDDDPRVPALLRRQAG